MKELTVKGLVTIEGMKFHEIEGGFGEGRKSMLAKEIAEIHGKKPQHINEAINKNRKRFVDMVDIIDLKGTKVAVDLVDSEIYSKNAVNASKNIYLLSERGYSKLLKILDDDFAWEQYDKLVDGYFAMRKIINSNEQLKAQLLLSIYNGGQEGIISAKQLTELEVKEATKPLLDKIEEDKPKVDYYEQMLATVGCRSTTDIAKDYGLSVQKLNKILHEQDVQYKSNSGQWLLYRKHDGKGYTQTSTYITKNNEAKYTTKWTTNGQLFIYNILKDLGIHPNK